jgi:hypothetical protein
MRAGEWSQLARDVAGHKRDPYSAIEEIAQRLRGHENTRGIPEGPA